MQKVLPKGGGRIHELSCTGKSYDSESGVLSGVPSNARHDGCISLRPFLHHSKAVRQQLVMISDCNDGAYL